jgi:signal transduction histidine kinase
LAFIATLADLASGHALLSLGAAALLGAASLLTLAVLARSTSVRQHPVPFVLLGTCLLALATRFGGFETIVHRSPEEWAELNNQYAEGLAERVSDRFADLCHRARLTAKKLAAEPSLIEAAAQPETREVVSAAFEQLEKAWLPHPLAEAVPGLVLYDRRQSPLAWSGTTVDLAPYFQTLEEPPASRIFVFEQGVFTHLVVIEPLGSGDGSLTVEIPLAARRRIDNRYLRDFDVVHAWSGKSVSTDYVDVRETAPELALFFERSGDRYWGGTELAPVFYFPMRPPSGELLAVVSLAAEDPAAALLESRRATQHVAGLFLSLAALFTVIWLGIRLWRHYGVGNALLFVAALWGFRLVLLFAQIPLGLHTSLDNPANYASDAFYDFFRSPIDFLVTALVIVLSATTLAFPILTRQIVLAHRLKGWLGAFLAQVMTRVAALALLLLTLGILYDTWVNSNLALATPGLAPTDAPRLAVQMALLALWFAAALLTVSLIAIVEALSERLGHRSFDRLVRYWVMDVLVFAFAYSISGRGSASAMFVLALPALLAFDFLAFVRTGLLVRLEQGGVYSRFATVFLVLFIPVLSFYPAVAYYENRIARQFIEQTVAPAVLHHGDSQLYVMRETLKAVDRMELAGQLGSPDRDQIAYQIWSGSDLSVFALSSAVEVFDQAGALVSRFALNFPDTELGWHEPEGPPPHDWIIDEETYPGEPNRPRVFHARRALPAEAGNLWDIQIRLVADWGNLAFIDTRNPYTDLFRSQAAETPLPFPHRELALYVFDRDGSPVFPPEPTLALDLMGWEEMEASSNPPQWIDDSSEGGRYHMLIFSDEQYVYGLAFPAKPILGYGADAAGWAILVALMALALFSIALGVGVLGGPVTLKPRDVWADVGTSFYGKLFVAFVLLALIPIASLAFLVRGIMVQQLQQDVEQEGIARARVVSRFVRDYLLLDTSERGVAAVSDPLLEWVSSLVKADVDLYSRGDLVATSERELFDSGLLPTRAVPTAYREVVLNRANHSIHRESVGAFQYLVVSVPIALERWREPGILSLPLASRQREIDERVAALNQTVLLAALCFFLIAAALAHSLAGRIAEPINTLTATTHRVAQGDFEVSLDTSSRDEIGALFESFNQMTTDLKRQREHLERTKKLEAWAEMARQVAHEVKNPLTPIQLSTEHLLRVYQDPNVDFEEVLKGCSDTILQQVHTLREISMEFSSFASPFPLSPEPTDIGRLVQETLQPYRQAPPPGVKVEIDLAPSLPTVTVDRRLIQRTLINLVENSLNAMNGGGRVLVAVHPGQSEGRPCVEMEISDTGVGIDPEIRARIFEPYFSTRAGGTGLGLAIVRKAVEEHGGTISVESETDRGTRVVIKLPVDAV